MAPETTPPRWINPALGFSVLLCFLAVSAVFIRDYRRSLETADLSVADVRVNLNGRVVREHCTTCHPGGGEAGGQGEHPEIAPHRIELLGCTGCHLGEGMALDPVLSHGLPGLGGRQVLSGKEVQGRCFSCHETAPLEGGAKTWRGARLFTEKACDSCHSIDRSGEGRRFGPDLSRIGDQLGLAQLESSLKDPDRDMRGSTMPRYPLSRTQVRDLTYYLKSRVAHPNHLTPMILEAGSTKDGEASQPSPEPERLLEEARCLACHKLGEQDGRIAPDLTWIGSLRERDYLEDFLRAPSRLIPGSHMPPAKVPESWLAPLADRLAGTAQVSLPGHEAKHLYMALCQRCHAANGDGRGLIQPNLAHFPRPFAGNAAFFLFRGEEQVRRSLRDGVPGTSMPPYGRLLDGDQREAVLELVYRSFIGIDRSAEVRRMPLPERPRQADPALAQQRYDALCVRCHGRAGTGSGDEAAGLLPKPRNLTNTRFFEALSDEQIARRIADGIPGTAMEPFRDALSPEELWSLVELVRNLSRRTP